LRNANALRVGFPFLSFIGPGIPPIRAQNDLRRAADFGDFFACSADTGGFKLCPCALAEALPFALRPPSGFFPSLRVHAGVDLVAAFFLLATWLLLAFTECFKVCSVNFLFVTRNCSKFHLLWGKRLFACFHAGFLLGLVVGLDVVVFGFVVGVDDV